MVAPDPDAEFDDDDDDGAPNTAKRRFRSTSSRFKTQLADLMAKLARTQSHFIRCILPNRAQRAGHFVKGTPPSGLGVEGGWR